MSRTTTQQQTGHGTTMIPGQGRQRGETGRDRRRGPVARAGAVLAAAVLLGTAGPALAATPAADADGHALDATWMVEEERAAGDLYEAFAGLYPQAAVFSRVARAEDRHQERVERATGAVAGTQAGVYADADLQELYDGWLADGSVSCQAALDTAVELETADIADLDALIARATAQGEPTAVWENLRTGSEHHLAAFSTATACTGGGSAQAGQGGGTGWNGRATGSGHHGAGAQGGGTGQGSGAQDRRQDGSCQDT